MAFVFPTTSNTVDMGAARRMISSVKPLATASIRITGMSGINRRTVPEVVGNGSMNMKNWAMITISVKTDPNLHSGLGDFRPMHLTGSIIAVMLPFTRKNLCRCFLSRNSIPIMNNAVPISTD